FTPDEIYFSADGTLAAAGGLSRVPTDYSPSRRTTARPIWIWDTATGQLRATIPPSNLRVLGFAPTGQHLLTAGNADTELVPTGVVGWNPLTGEKTFFVQEMRAEALSIAANPRADILIARDAENRLGFWRSPTAERIGTLQALAQGEWLVTTPSGLFDGSPQGWSQIAWRTADGPLSASPGEIFFNEFYRPGLLAELIAGRPP
ncbi:MAG TPA: hypothetical protein DEH78_08605, partial [Solibacterales bacterium]|nr:hypothetical protein [Bryobacterales bacterium]